MGSSTQADGVFSMIFPEREGSIGYFCMEIALAPDVHTYSGGLGILAGDTLRSAADIGLPLCAVTLAQRKGYFRQQLDEHGVQTEQGQPWAIEERLTLEEPVIEVTLENRPVLVRAWRWNLEGVTGHIVPVYLLDTNIEQNDPRDREITDSLYGGDSDYRLRQEAILGIGGFRMLAALGWTIGVYHMNEGHSALLTAAYLQRRLRRFADRTLDESDIKAVRNHCVFTTHTPVPAGHDQFSLDQTARILGPGLTHLIQKMGGEHEGNLNMTYLALASSRYTNAVSMQHGKVSREMFPEYHVDAITNGVHAGTWTAPPIQELFNRRIPGWRRDNFKLRYMIDAPVEEIEAAHAESKRQLFSEVKSRTGIGLNEEQFTIGFARRVATYKRADLLFTNPERLTQIAEQFGGIQILYGGKAHPHDDPAKALIRRIFEIAAQMKSSAIRVIYLENYEWELAAHMTSGVDLWLNTPRRPYEASGTSGMKAALNGVPSLSILDGWWIEGCVDGTTGWAIANKETQEEEVASLYERLESTILPLYYHDHRSWLEVMRSTLALNGAYFNTHRMLAQYIADAYFPRKTVHTPEAAPKQGSPVLASSN